MLGNFSLYVWRVDIVGGLKGFSKNMIVGKEGKEKLDLIKGKKILNGEFVLFGCSRIFLGNTVEFELFKFWLGKVVEDV